MAGAFCVEEDVPAFTSGQAAFEAVFHVGGTLFTKRGMSRGGFVNMIPDCSRLLAWDQEKG